MSYQSHLRQAKLARARNVFEMRRLYHLVRPIYLHDRSPDRKKCSCGCGSRNAKIIREIGHHEILIDAYKGTRSVRSKLKTDEERAKFDELARLPITKRIEVPVRVHSGQLRVVTEREASIIYVNGGTRGGKTTVAAERLWDLIVEKGGRGSVFAWVAPTLALAWTGMKKLVRGERTDRFVPPIIPPELVRRKPHDKAAQDWTVTLVDGTTILFMHAGRDGDNLKSIAVTAAVYDEATASKHEQNFVILRNRLIDTGGSLVVPTTPKAGHWLKQYQAEQPSFEDADELAANGGEYPFEVRTRMTAFDNPWINEKRLRREIEALGGEENMLVRREYFGEWVGQGERMWPFFNFAQHVQPIAMRNVERSGWLNLTAAFGRDLFYGESDEEIREIGGQDFNVRPMSLLVGKVICHRSKDPTDPANWKLYIEDEIVKVARSTSEFAHFVAKHAGKSHGRGLPADYFAGLHIVADRSGFFHEARFRGPTATADAELMEREGFVMRAPIYVGEKRTPTNPPRRLRHQLVNQLFQEGRIIVNSRCKSLIESLKNETDDGSGDQGKRSGTKADELSGPTDALGYLVYCLFGPHTDVDHLRNEVAA